MFLHFFALVSDMTKEVAAGTTIDTCLIMFGEEQIQSPVSSVEVSNLVGTASSQNLA
jgi:hypothetical protein